MEGMYSFASDCIKTAYPNANISRNYSPTGGQFQIFVKNKNGEEVEMYNKIANDGAFSEKTAVKALERIKKLVEN